MEFLIKLGLVDGADDLIDHLSALEEEDGRDVADAILHGKVFVLLGAVQVLARIDHAERRLARDHLVADLVDDVSLDEFTDAIEPWIIDELKKIGFETARGVLGAQRDMIVQNADLEEETVDEVLRILQAEFE